ncbi:ergothioneine biosynthesis protein EgtB [Actinobacteria bacterium IMCC26207]|nr:ergothioneine biosynthesis protein EgtB [Actinobacteria bacterium IMCC26207]
MAGNSMIQPEVSHSDPQLTQNQTQVDDLLRVRELTEQLAAPLSPEDQTVQSMPDASPAKWHRAHTTWFFETFLLQPHLESYEPFNSEFAHLFNSYYESLGSRHPRAERGLLSRPSAEEVGRYRRYVDAELNRLFESEGSAEVADLLTLGLHHEQQHQELLVMDALHLLSLHPASPAYKPDEGRADEGSADEGRADEGRIDEGRTDAGQVTATAPMNWLRHEGGLATIGQAESAAADRATFCFDNERPQHQVYLSPYEISDRLITCGEWLEFLEDGGYCRSELWMAEGWALVAEQELAAPMYWRAEGTEWKVFGLAGKQPLNPHQPVSNISWFEADAFARWSGARLPTEAEWEVAANAPVAGAHLNLYVLAPRSAGSSPDAQQWFGELWQWTESSYRPYPGYRASAGAIGEYNGKFMMNQQVLRGSSFATPAGHARRTYRNFFAPAKSWMFSGVRLARDIP